MKRNWKTHTMIGVGAALWLSMTILILTGSVTYSWLLLVGFLASVGALGAGYVYYSVTSGKTLKWINMEELNKELADLEARARKNERSKHSG